MSLIFLHKVSSNREAFASKVIAGSQQLGFDPNWLMAIMNFESGLDHTRVNSISGATGLIQFMPATAKQLGTSTTALKQMSNVQQLDYVFKYLRVYKDKIHYFIDLYFAVFFPLAINKPLDFILEAKNLSRSLVARQNPIFDKNKDGQLTVSEIQDVVFNAVPEQYRPFLKKKY
jgi:hypothetical protein